MKSYFKTSFISKVFLIFFLFSILTLFLSSNSYAQRISMGTAGFASCAIDVNGNLYVWGYDNYTPHTVVSQSSKVAQDSTPVLVAFPTGVTAWTDVATGGGFILALGSDGNIYSWGWNYHGQLGNGDSVASNTLVMVLKPIGVTSWTAIDAGDSSGYAIGNDGNVYAWGANNQGQLGQGGATAYDSANAYSHSAPLKVMLPTGVTVTKLSAAANSAMVLGSDGNLYVWGINNNGQFGNGTSGGSTARTTPMVVPLPLGITAVTPLSGGFHNGAICSDGNLYLWGSSGNGQCLASSGNVTSPKLITMPGTVTSWKQVYLGCNFSLAIGNNDTVYAWGYGLDGEMGNNTTTKTNSSIIAVNLPTGTVPVQISAAHNHCLLMDNNFNLYSWGQNTQGQIGINNTTNPQILPIQVLGVNGTGNLVLPVELTSFTASSTSDGVLLKWATATENNNSGFEIERSADNKIFSQVGFVKGNGNSTRLTEYSYLDKNISGSVYYRLNQVDYNGTAKYSQTIEVNAVQPNAYSLEQNYPNPFNPTTVINYSVAKDGFVALKVYNMLGQEVANVYQGFQKAGAYKANFDASKLASGMYLYKLESGSFTETKKMLLLK